MLDGLFAHPAGYSDTDTARELIAAYYATIEFFRSLLNLQRAVQLCVDLAAHVIADTDARPPSTMAENFEVLKELKIISSTLAERMMKAVGFRNIAVHSYQAIDWNIVFQICRHHLGDFQQFAQAVAQRLQPF